MNYLFFLILPFLIFSVPIFAQTPVDESSNFEYILEIDQHEYLIPYVVNANVIAMEIDPESKSLLIGLDDTYDSVFSITVEHELINAQNNEFVILVNGYEVNYEMTSNSVNSTFTFFVPAGSEEVEIIGTSAIPEFPIGSVFGFAVIISSIMIFAKIKAPFFRL